MLTDEHIQGTCRLTTFQHINNSCIPQENLHSFKLPVNTAQLVTNWSKPNNCTQSNHWGGIWRYNCSIPSIIWSVLVTNHVWTEATRIESSSSQEEDKTTLQIVARWIKDQISCGFHHSHNLCVARAHWGPLLSCVNYFFPVQYSRAHHSSPPIHSLS